VPAHLLILLIHGGAFLFGNAASMQPQANEFHRLAPHAQVRSVEYPLGSPDLAYDYVRRIAVRHRGPVIVYGFSAGGWVATRLAARGEITAAVTIAGVYHLDAWARFARFPPLSRAILGITSAAGRRRLNPHPGASAVPQLMLHGDRDPTAPLSDAKAYAREDRFAHLWIMHGIGHDQPAGPVSRAMRWVLAEIRRPWPEWISPNTAR